MNHDHSTHNDLRMAKPLMEQLLRSIGVACFHLVGTGPLPSICAGYLREKGVAARAYKGMEQLRQHNGQGTTADSRGVLVWMLNQQVPETQIDIAGSVSVDRICIIHAAAEDQMVSCEGLERAFIGRGWRKSACVFKMQDYSRLDEASSARILLFEPIPEQAWLQYPPARLALERDLHMDMTREAGRRSDAHLVRYALAAQFVREGDAVLDSACGLGYGTAALRELSRPRSLLGIDVSETAVDYAHLAFMEEGPCETKFCVGDAEDLESVKQDSIDFVVSVETLEHLRAPEKFLQRAFDALTQGGRLFVSVPYDWSDETGEDPNPYHFHVYDWGKLEQQLTTAGFVLERAWLQDAGGGMKRHDSPRGLREFDPINGPSGDGEWLLALVMKPLAYVDVSLSERPSKPIGEANILAFDRDYQNPAIVRALVADGWRIHGAAPRKRMALEVLAGAGKSSADYGAALCVFGYCMLSEPIEVGSWQKFLSRVDVYLESDIENPTIYRWKVSLTYLSGMMHLAMDRREDALPRFEACAAMDAASFSPLLATKTLGARYAVGLLLLGKGEFQPARDNWDKAIDDAFALLRGLNWREVIASREKPASFGFPELAHVISIAGKCAAAIRFLPGVAQQPGLFWEGINSSVFDRVAQLLLERDLLSSWSQERSHGLETEIENLAGSLGLLRTEIGERDSSISRLRDHIDDRNTAIQWLQSQLEAHRAQIDEAGTERQQLLQNAGDKDDAINWLEQQLRAHIQELQSRDTAILELKASLDQLDEARAWLLEQIDSHRHEIASRDETLGALELALQQAGESRDWLSAQLDSHRAEIASRDETLGALELALQQAGESRDWLSAQLDSHRAEIASRDETLGALELALQQAGESRDWLSAQLDSHRAEIASRDESLAALDETLQHAGESRAWLSGQLDSHRLELDHREQSITALKRELDVGHEARQWLEGQLLSHQAALSASSDQLVSKEHALAEVRARVDDAEGRAAVLREELNGYRGRMTFRIMKRLRLL